MKIDQQIGRIVHKCAGVQFFSARHTSDGWSLGLCVRKVSQSGLDCTAYAFCFGSLFQNAGALAAFEIEVNSSQTNSVGVRLRPVDSGEAVAELVRWLAAIPQRQKPVLP